MISGFAILSFLVSFAFLVVAMTVHEFAHGWVAYKLGDNTAKFYGRLTLNPLAHIDPIGTLLLPLFLYIISSGQFVFGAAKPVPINYLQLKNPRRDIIWVGLSGPAANFLFAAILACLLKFLPHTHTLVLILTQLILINLVLGIFNLIPIPPLDGSRVFLGILPNPIASLYASIEPYGFFIVMLLVWLGAFDIILWPVITVLFKVLTGAPVPA